MRPPPVVNAPAVLPTWDRRQTGGQVEHDGGSSRGQTVRETLGLSEMSIYVKPGAILPLQANASRVQHTAQAGGLLELQIYAGGWRL